MVIKKIVRGLLKSLKKIREWAEEDKKIEESVYEAFEENAKNINITPKTVFSVWDILSFKEGSQAEHITQVLSFDEWLSMEEIRRRIEEFIHVNYKNQRSLYPYLKTLVDCSFVEASGVGGIRKWRKKDKLIELPVKKEIKKEQKNAIITATKQTQN